MESGCFSFGLCHHLNCNRKHFFGSDRALKEVDIIAAEIIAVVGVIVKDQNGHLCHAGMQLSYECRNTDAGMMVS